MTELKFRIENFNNWFFIFLMQWIKFDFNYFTIYSASDSNGTPIENVNAYDIEVMIEKIFALIVSWFTWFFIFARQWPVNFLIERRTTWFTFRFWNIYVHICSAIPTKNKSKYVCFNLFLIPFLVQTSLKIKADLDSITNDNNKKKISTKFTFRMLFEYLYWCCSFLQMKDVKLVPSYWKLE